MSKRTPTRVKPRNYCPRCGRAASISPILNCDRCVAEREVRLA